MSKIWLSLIGVYTAVCLGSMAAAEIPPEWEKDVNVTAIQEQDAVTSLAVKDGLVFKAKVGNSDKEYTFLLDTGAEMCAIDSKITKELALDKIIEVDSRDANEKLSKVRVYKADALTVGKMTVHNLPIIGLDMNFLGTIYGVPIDGLIGYNFLKRFAVTIDYQHSQMILSLKRQLPPTSGALFATINKDDYAVTLPVSVEGVPVHPFIDTGAMSEYLCVPSTLLERCKVKRGSKGGMSAGAFGYSNQSILARANVTVGDYEFHDALVTSSSIAVVGQKFLSQFTIVLDYPGQQAWLVPYGQVFMPKDEFGIGLGVGRNAQGFLVVTGVWEQSPADLAGIHAGDVIIEINGMKTGDETEAFWRELLHGTAVSKLEIVVQNSQGKSHMVLEKANLLSPFGTNRDRDGFYITGETYHRR